MLGNIKSNILFPLSELFSKREVYGKLVQITDDAKSIKKLRLQRKQQQLFTILSIANTKVPFYKDLFKKIEFNPEDILKDIKFIQDIPFTNKEMLRESPKRFINSDYNLKELIERKTGGSTGLTNSIYYDKEALDWSAAANLFAIEITGRKHHKLECILSTEPEKDSLKELLHLKAKSVAMNRCVVFLESLSDDTLEEVWKKLGRIEPYLIQAHPSTVYALSKYIEKNHLTAIPSIRAFESTGESLERKKIKTIEKNIGCKVYNRLGNAEFGVFAHSRKNPMELEVLDYMVHAENLSIGNGLEEIILTTTTNRAMPLIRYQTGDFGEIVEKDDRDVIINVYGRIHDTVNIDGEIVPTHYIQSMMDNIGGIDEFQIVKKENEQFILKIVPSGKVAIDSLRNTIFLKFGNKFKVVFTNFDGLTRCGWRDKFRYVVQES